MTFSQPWVPCLCEGWRCGELRRKALALMVGVPARQVDWMSNYGERVELPL